nr:MAG TPA: hypothetical protein [Caudoviricetes sp.]
MLLTFRLYFLRRSLLLICKILIKCNYLGCTIIKVGNGFESLSFHSSNKIHLLLSIVRCRSHPRCNTGYTVQQGCLNHT